MEQTVRIASWTVVAGALLVLGWNAVTVAFPEISLKSALQSVDSSEVAGTALRTSTREAASRATETGERAGTGLCAPTASNAEMSGASSEPACDSQALPQLAQQPAGDDSANP